MAILKYILPLAATILLTGCYENFNPDLESKPVLCLNSLISAGEPIDVRVTHTWRFNDLGGEENHEVEDAIVSVMANGESVARQYIPREGDLISITAESDTYGSASATVTVPHATPIAKVSMTPKATMSTFYDDNFTLSFNVAVEVEIADPIEHENYYDFSFYSYDGEEPEMPTFNLGWFEYDLEPIFKEHIGVFESIMGSDAVTDLIFTDRQFSGKTYTLHLNFYDNTLVIPTAELDESIPDCGITLRLASVSRSYYNWKVYKWNINEGLVGEMSEIGLAGTIWGYSNVSTGAGVVAGQSFTDYTLNLKPFLQAALKEAHRKDSITKCKIRR